MGRLTTHILDTANGRPAAGVAIRLCAVREQRVVIATATTDHDGRTPQPLLAGEALQDGVYELEFDVGRYFASGSDEPPFLDTVVIRVSLQSGQHYHVPLLVSPWSYTTYRGS